MIINLLLNIVFTIFSILTIPMQIPSMPESVKEIVAAATDYLVSGVSFLSVYFDMNYLLMLFSMILVVDVNIFFYKIIMWILRKVPLIDIK